VTHSVIGNEAGRVRLARSSIRNDHTHKN